MSKPGQCGQSANGCSVYLGEWYQKEADLNRQLVVSFFPSDNSVELIDVKTRKTFLRRTKIEELSENDFFIGAKLLIFGKHIDILDFGDQKTRSKKANEQLSFGMIKAEALLHLGEILSKIHEAGLGVRRLAMLKIDENYSSMLKSVRSDTSGLSYLMDCMPSQSFVALEIIGKNAYNQYRELCGPESVCEARENAANTFRERKKRIAARTRKLNTPQPIDLDVLIEDRIKQLKDNSFIFLSYAFSKSSELFTPKTILDDIMEAYGNVEEYVLQFDRIRLSYQENLAVDHGAIRGETNLEVLRAYCERFCNQMMELEKIQESHPLGLLQVKQVAFREEISPICQQLLAVLDETIPCLAMEKINFVKQKGEEIQTKLMIVPEETNHYIYYFNHLEVCHELLASLQKELNYAHDALKIMQNFKVAFSDEDKDKYLDMEEFLTEIREMLTSKREQKQDLINKFDLCLQSDITKIFSEVEEILEEVLKEWLLDIASDQARVRDCLIDLSERLTMCQRKAQEYKKYQKEFRLEVTRFEKLDLVINEVKLRQILWDSVQQWKESVEIWNEIHFHELNMEEVEALNTKILKNCAMLDKNLPKNDIIPRLKAEAEEFKDKIPVLGFLRNPALKTRHWIKIEQILNRHLTEETEIYLHTFEDANAFEEDIASELMEVSNMASAEAGLEMLLNKVENAWKEFELCVVNHRDHRDVFVLAGIEEIQTVLDESSINVSTVAASRHVGPIKPKVDDWVSQLDLFSRTLDEWMLCQQSWIYLEAIFSAPDIQRQLPHETQMFLQVDKAWKDLMRRTYRTPLALAAMTAEGVLEQLQVNNVLLEKVTRCLEAYLEVKRMAFPRLYFLSNDELLEILAQTKNPFAVQPHLPKCFDAIAMIEFAEKTLVSGEEPVMTNDIKAMISPEGERLEFGLGLKARGAVEDWLSKVEEAMFLAVKRYMRQGYRTYGLKDRSYWMQEHPSQVVLTVSQQQWAADVHKILDGSDNVDKSSDFEWLKMLRYYWLSDAEVMETKMASANLPYFYEYLGASGVLVITPLTDRCYLCLMGALQMDLGGAPAGPAGTGKTETTKDLAKALAIQCVVFNCSDGLDYKMMGRFFTGLAQSGAWCCFDEFNRIDIEVLSVIAQQLITIRHAKAAKMKRFLFEGREIRLKPSCAAFITMNPGYAGRTELPDNLKALFRPISMMVPDYALIAEVILYSEGFEGSKMLAKKMVQMYKLCSEQLSQQDHYDFGMRAVKSVLVMAGALKRASPDQPEDVTLISALRDSNLPKFLANDAVLFNGILSDLFPGVELPEPERGDLQKSIEQCMVERNLQPVPEMVRKTLQLYETMVVRWGVMLVGPTGSGKTTVLHMLSKALEKLYAEENPEPLFRPVRIQTLNPKAISMDELYGFVNLATMEWHDGLLGLAIRSAVSVTGTQGLHLMERGEAKHYVFKMFTWSLLWSFGGNLMDDSKERFEQHYRTLLTGEQIGLLPKDTLWDFRINTKTRTWESWNAIHPKFVYNPVVPYFDLLVPTLDTTKYSYVSEMLLQHQYPVMYTGDTGVGKSVLAREVLNRLMQNDVIPITVNFSAQSESARTQQIIESRLERRKKTLLGAPINKKIIVFIDDVNMPKLDRYGSQAPIELLRQFADFRGVYDREKMYWKDIVDVTLGAACAPPGGGRNVLTPRFIRHFALFSLPSPSSDTLKTIFKALLGGFLNEFSMAIRPLAEPIVETAVSVYERILAELLPTPKKSHYVFNLRDLSKCIQGVLQADPSSYINPMQLMRLFYHEALRIFYDRLINDEDKAYFKQLLQDCCEKYFETTIVQPEETILFGDFMVYGQAAEDRVYEEIKEMKKLKTILSDYLEDYNSTIGTEMNLVFFGDAIEHIVRLSRLLRSERGNGLLVGVSGMGKQSLAKLAAHINGYQCHQIALRRGYDHGCFHEDLRRIYWIAGVLNKATVFLITDTQIVHEAFMEDINNILNSGEVPNLFQGDEYEKIILNLRQPCIESGFPNQTRDGIFEFFTKRVRSNLHVIICMSPVGETFRRRCRMFPSLVNCCTIDWFVKWPAEALRSVAIGSLKDVSENEVQCKHLAQICVMVHESVESISERFFREMRRHYYTTPSSYLQLLQQYRLLVQKRIETILHKKDRIANGLSKILETNQVVAEMGEELKKFVPVLEEKTKNMNELVAKLNKDSAMAKNVEHSVAKDEAEAKSKAAETQEIADEAAKDLEIVLPTLQAAQDALKSLNKNDINELRVFQKPPKLVQFVMEATIEKVSKVAKSMCLWVIAIEKYAKIYKIVEPKIKRQKAAEKELGEVMQLLKSKQSELAEIEAKISMLLANLEEKKREMKLLQDHNDLTAARLNRAGRLTSALADEEVRWRETVKQLTAEHFAVPGDVLVASAYVAYLGAFPIDYRRTLSEIWVSECKRLNIPSSPTFNLVQILGDSFQIREWSMYGLPRDEISIENAIIATEGGRWPLMIDPQEQANRWIRNMESKNELKIIKLTDSNMMRVLEICIRQGAPMLIEDVQDTLDPVLGTVLMKQVFLRNGRFMIKLEIIKIELPEMEKQRSDLIITINADKQQLLLLEDKILKTLYSSQGNILDDEDLVESLNESKEMSTIIADRLIETERTEVTIAATREKYRMLAVRGAILYFVVASLSEIDPMYQFSLRYFTQVYCSVIEQPHTKMELQERLESLLDGITFTVFANICRGLFEKHKLICGFLVAFAICKEAGEFSDEEVSFIVRGPSQRKFSLDGKPPFLTENQWIACCFLEVHDNAKFAELTKHLGRSMKVQIEDFKEDLCLAPEPEATIVDWNERLSVAEKLMLVAALKDEFLVMAVTEFIRHSLGKRYTEPPKNTSLASLFADISPTTPLVFVLSPGSDPMTALIKFAQERECVEKLHSISLGQGQGPAAESLIEAGTKGGHWVFLQNCHLATSWMESMEKIVNRISLGLQPTEPGYRLFLSSMPVRTFPISVLQNSVKVTNEPPKGLRSNLIRSITELDRSWFEFHVLGAQWRAMIFGLCMFHGVILERRKFGPLGWNITYEFSENDRACALRTLDIYCDRENRAPIPWDALEYINGEITYGGRVTDAWDQRCLRSILKRFSSSRILDPQYSYSASGFYMCPDGEGARKMDDYLAYVTSLPIHDPPDIFGMHENANIIYNRNETRFFLDTLLESQSGGDTMGEEALAAMDKMCLEKIDSIRKLIATAIGYDDLHPSLLQRDSRDRIPSLSTVLLQEVERFDRLLITVHSSLNDLEKAIQGFVVMSERLETIYRAFGNNQVPQLWHSKGYLSTKTLASWITDLQYRIDYVRDWCASGLPTSSWICGLFFPQSFLTGALQTYARKHNVPIDTLRFDFEVMGATLQQSVIYKCRAKKDNDELYGNLCPPEDGVFIHGLFIEAGRWDREEGGLCDAMFRQLVTHLPAVWLKPCTTLEIGQRYEAPLYKTSARAGVLSTTGQSTNFVLAILLDTEQPIDHWVLRGTALVTSITD
ncbi:dynein axonemal heavy chain 6 [Anopheles aquasalis]|uniref:dynein axonemal heavy chain 6 n=1 Tax=Anopheles aquasalis TaxID=42839 RepID=UPI00215A140E|nr:dynein axonemal heavy chain 6 [Anopheles aquasalis]